MQQIRLNKYLAERLGISRREADGLIKSGRITVNGQAPILGTKVDSSSIILYDGKELAKEIKYQYVAFNKPVGYVCSRRAQGDAPTLYSLLPKDFRKLKTVGRLDKDSSGLIILTNDGDFAFRMTHPKFRKEKIYQVELNKPLVALHRQMISDFGVEIGDGISKFAVISEGSLANESVSSHNDRSLGPDKKKPSRKYIVILSEGRNRQIRRTFAALGYEVVGLNRIQFGKYQLGGLKPGKYDIIKP